MGYLTSPGITINEIDSTNVVPALSTSSGGYAGHFNWGPAEQIVSVSSEKELGAIFGTPVSGDTTSASFLTAASFLKYGNSLSVVRAIDSTDLNATSTGLGVQIKNAETFDANNGISSPFAARYAGSLGNGIQVIVLHGSDNINFDGPSSSTIAAKNVSLAINGNPFENLLDEFHLLVIDSLGKFSGTAGTILEKFAGLSLASDAKDVNGASLYYKDVINQNSAYIYAGSLATSYYNADKTLADALNTGGFYRLGYAEWINATLSFNGKSTITSIINGVTQDPVIENNIIKFVAQSNFAGFAGTKGNNITVTFVKAISGAKTCVVTAPDSANGFINVKYTYSGTNTFTAGELSSYLNDALVTSNALLDSKIKVYVGNIDLRVGPQTGQETEYAIAANSIIQFSPALVTGQPATYSLSGGNNLGGQNLFLLLGGADSIKRSQSVVNALDVIGLSDPNIIDINLLFTENSVNSSLWVQFTVDDALFTIVESRRNLVGFISAPLSITSMTSNVAKQDAILAKFQDQTLGAGSSFIVFDSTPVYVYNKYTDTYSWIAAAGHMAGLCANTDLVSEPWSSPAGYTRGQLRGVTKLAYNPNQNDRDTLYKARINPIVSFPGKGILLFGDKTSQAKPGAFDRINVRRLFNTLEKAVANASQYQLFEINDEFTRSSFRNTIEPYLRDIKGRRGIIDFKIVCDDTNNTAGVIDSNRFVADIFIKPVHSVNFITLNFIATRTGVEFKTLVG
jgi:hypothetical protein